MRGRLALILCCLVAVASADDTAIKSVVETPSKDVLQNGNLLHLGSGFKVTIDKAYLAQHVDPQKTQKLLNQLAVADKLTDYSKDGLSAIKELKDSFSEAPSVGRLHRLTVLQKVAPMYEYVLGKLEQYPADAQAIDQQFRANLRDPVKQLTIFFEAADTLATKVRTEVDQSLPQAQVRLVQYRTKDTSRIPDQPFGYIPADAEQRVKDLVAKLAPNATDPQPADLLNGLLSDLKTKAKEGFDKLKGDLDKIAQDFQTKLQAVIDLPQSNDTKWKDLTVNYQEIVALSGTIKDEVTALSGASGANDATTKARSLLSDLTSLVAKINALALTAKDLATADAITETAQYKALVALTKDIPKEVSDDLQGVVTDITNSVQSVLNLLNLTQDLAAIGQVLSNADKDGVVTYLCKKGNVLIGPDGSVGDSSLTLQSYDKLNLSVVVPNPADATKPTEIGQDFDLTVWDTDRWDTVVAVGYYHQTSNHWTNVPIVGQLHKTYAGRSLRAAASTPTFGYSLLTVDSDSNGQTEFAVGGLIGLFDDHIVGGYAYNTGGKGAFWYVGYRFAIK
ncbi:MAG: hypothetical protein GC165_05620 [Armatimonadetes bacterium]|nr:hypothetical protein [Armatimonadota bacterium]